MVNLDLQRKVLKFLETAKGEKITTLEELAAYFNINFVDFMNKVACREIVDYLEKNKAVLKAKLRRKWMSSQNATLNLSVYKLMANGEELLRLSGEVTNKGIQKKDPLLEVLQADKIWAEGN